MRTRLLFASAMTVAVLFSFVFFVLFMIAFWANMINLRLLIALTVLTNVILWLVNPSIMDWVQKAFYKVRWVSLEEFNREHKDLAAFIKKVCENSRVLIPIPRLRIIEDYNPVAYCYGSYKGNARIVLSDGIFKYLDIEEQKAVVAHEIGHIANNDFIIMTLAVTLTQVLYEIYYNLLRRRSRSSSGSKKGDITPLIGAVSYFFYLIGSYLVLYLSRTREYLADRFSALHTSNPDALSMALVKIAYGIAAEVDTESTQRLLESTRSLGIYDFKAAQSVGTIFKMAVDKEKTQVAKDITKVFLFDIFSPWGSIAEMNSTHPLVGKRVKVLSDYNRWMGKEPLFNFEKVVQECKNINKRKLYNDFATGVVIYLLPFFAAFAGLLIFFANPEKYPIIIVLIGASIMVQGIYGFQRIAGGPEKATVFELMQDPYANPLHGRYVELEGRVIGKADAGSYFGEDVKMQDRSDCLIYLNYESAMPIIGNIVFGVSKAKDMIGQYCRSVGWFRRSSYQVIDLDIVEVNNESIKSYTRFWGIIMGSLVVAAGIFAYVMSILW